MVGEKMRIDADESGNSISVFEFEQRFRAGAKNIKDIFSLIEDDLRQFGNTYSPATIKTYESQARKLKRFCENLPFTEITPYFWQRYDSHLITLENNSNTRWKAFRFITSYISKAIQYGILKSDPLKTVKVKKPKGNRVALTIEEVRLLEQFYCGMMPMNLKKVLLYFLFACFTGMRFSDVKDLKFSNYFSEDQNPYLHFIQHKTKVPLTLPLNNKALTYLQATGTPDQNVFSTFSSQYTNVLLKKIMTAAGITKSISFHCSRNTCATILHELSGDFYTTSKILGQTSLASTAEYVSPSEKYRRQVVEMMNII